MYTNRYVLQDYICGICNNVLNISNLHLHECSIGHVFNVVEGTNIIYPSSTEELPSNNNYWGETCSEEFAEHEDTGFSQTEFAETLIREVQKRPALYEYNTAIKCRNRNLIANL